MRPDLHFSSREQVWATPWDFFEKQASQYGPFDLDVCALPHNSKCLNFISPASNGLLTPWRGVCWMNPPYGRAIGLWVKRAVDETANGHARRVVSLLPARTDTAWWHNYVFSSASTVVFLRGRLKFAGAVNSAPFPSAIAVFGRLDIGVNHESIDRRITWQGEKDTGLSGP